jgi:PleD family two-component response regulator
MKDGDNSPLALVACADEWMCRSIESVFEQNGYTVSRIALGRRALDLARRVNHDVLLLCDDLEDLRATEVCRALRDDPLFDHSTPIVLTTTGHVTSESRADAYAAGAWEYCTQPVDMRALFLKLGTFLRAREELATARAQRLVDPESGFYTSFGFRQVASQLSARAQRYHEPFACLAFSQEPTATGDGEKDLADVANVFRAQGRKSDVIGYVGESRLALLAPDTDAAGVRFFFARLQRELTEASKDTASPRAVKLRAGYCAVSDFATANMNLVELVNRAESALDYVQVGGADGAILGFEELPAT